MALQQQECEKGKQAAIFQNCIRSQESVLSRKAALMRPDGLLNKLFNMSLEVAANGGEVL